MNLRLRAKKTEFAALSELYITQRGTWGGSLIFLLKSFFTEHPTLQHNNVIPFCRGMLPGSPLLGVVLSAFEASSLVLALRLQL